MTSFENPVEHNIAKQRFECTVDGLLCVADYQMSNGVMLLTHTRVPDALQGRGVASALIAEALEHARAEGLKIDPLCSFARVYMQRHPEAQALLAHTA
jgi:predicted GNAT family acetyltransferase